MTITVKYCAISFWLIVRANIRVSGIVQGVGFRPFIYRLATDFNLKGHVRNLGDAGVEIVVQGEKNKVESFLHSIKAEAPPLSVIDDELSVSA